MTTAPWRIASQSVAVLDPESKDPILTLQFHVDHNAADVMNLRLAPYSLSQDALEIAFSTGGYVLGTPVKQPRWLKPFERVDPNLHLDDDDAWNQYAEGLGEDQARAMDAKRKNYLSRRDAWQEARDMSDRDGNKPSDGSDPHVPLNVADDGKVNEVGTVSTPPAAAPESLAPEPAGGSGPAPKGKVVDSKSLKAQKEPV